MSKNDHVSSDDDDGGPPPYSVIAPSTHSALTISQLRQNYQLLLTHKQDQDRTFHLTSIFDSVIHPIVRHRSSLGLSRTRIALMPAAVSNGFDAAFIAESADVDDFPVDVPEILGLASAFDDSDLTEEDDMVQIQLEMERDSTRFWNQDSVLAELQSIIESALSRSSDHEHDINLSAGVDSKTPLSNRKQDLEDLRRQENDNVSNRDRGEISSPPTPSRTIRRGLLERLRSRSQPQVNEYKSRNAAASASQADDKTMAEIRKSVTVKVELGDICLRTRNSFGLYDSIRQEGVIVQVEFAK